MKPQIDQPGKASLPHEHHDNPAVNSCDLPLMSSPFRDGKHSSQSKSKLLRSSKHSGFGLGDSNVCPDNPSGCDPSLQGGPYLNTSWSYLKWCASLVPSVLRSRTPFASFFVAIHQDVQDSFWKK